MSEELQEPLLPEQGELEADLDEGSSRESGAVGASFGVRLVTSIGIFWTAAGLASCVQSIDIVWSRNFDNP